MQKIVYPLIAVVVCIVIAYAFLSQSTGDYATQIETKRFQKELFFLRSSDSPFKDKNRVEDIQYFAPKEAYKVQASIEVFETPKPVEIATSNGKSDNYLQYAYLNFELQGQKYKLLALRENIQMPNLWVGFRDATSGKTTYGGGRYLDLAYRNGQKTITLDFNLAYNPYCAYTEGFACPIPPRENTLPIAIEAGEKDFVK